MIAVVAAGQKTKAVLAAGSTFTLALECMIDWLLSFYSPVAAVLRAVGRPLLPREYGLAASAVFPLPVVQVPPLSASTRFAWTTAWLVNIWVAFLNVARAGSEEPQVCRYLPSTAQSRCLDSLLRRAKAFVGE